jgi:hypothetical protein
MSASSLKGTDQMANFIKKPARPDEIEDEHTRFEIEMTERIVDELNENADAHEMAADGVDMSTHVMVTMLALLMINSQPEEVRGRALGALIGGLATAVNMDPIVIGYTLFRAAKLHCEQSDLPVEAVLETIEEMTDEKLTECDRPKVRSRKINLEGSSPEEIMENVTKAFAEITAEIEKTVTKASKH